VDQAAAEAAPGRQMKVLGRRRRGAHESRDPRGQSLVEFALVLPLLMIFLLGVADLGRVFADGIGLEAASRDAAEAAAQQYMQDCSKYSPGDCSTGLQPADYSALHTLARSVGCREAERMTNRQLTGGVCTNPVIAVCVHDDLALDSAGCGQESLTGDADHDQFCSGMNVAGNWSAARDYVNVDGQHIQGPPNGRPYVEVRMCYLFNPLIPLTKGWWGSIWLQRHNDFAVTNY
jgi:hypothetical protein